jgi:hypothetical protein
MLSPASLESGTGEFESHSLRQNKVFFGVQHPTQAAISQLATIRYTYNIRGQLEIESKEDGAETWRFCDSNDSWMLSMA